MSELVQQAEGRVSRTLRDGEGRVSGLFGVGNAQLPQAETTSVRCHMFHLRLLDNKGLLSCFYSA